MFDSMMRLVEQQNADGAIRRPEFDPPRPSETSFDDKSRAELIDFIDRATPERHKVQLIDGRTAVVFFDQRGRAVSAVLDDLDDDTLNWILQSKNLRGDPLPKSDPGYPQAVEEERATMRSPTEDEVKALRDFVREVGGKGYSVKQHKTVKGTSVGIHPPYPAPSSGSGAVWVKVAKWLIQNGWVQFPGGDTDYLEKQQSAAEKYDAFYGLGNLMMKGGGGVSEEAEALSPKVRTAMERFVYAKLPPDAKMKKGGRMLTLPAGTWAQVLGVKSYTGVYMDEIPDEKLVQLATRWGFKSESLAENIAKGASERAKSFDVPGGSMHASTVGDEPVTSWNVATADGTKVAIVVKGGPKATGGGSGVAEVFWPGMKNAGFRGRVMMTVNGAIKLKREVPDATDAELPALVRKYRTESIEEGVVPVDVAALRASAEANAKKFAHLKTFKLGTYLYYDGGPTNRGWFYPLEDQKNGGLSGLQSFMKDSGRFPKPVKKSISAQDRRMWKEMEPPADVRSKFEDHPDFVSAKTESVETLSERSQGPVRHSRDYMDPTVEIFTVSTDDMDEADFEKWLRHRGIRGKISKIGKNLQVVVAEERNRRAS